MILIRIYDWFLLDCGFVRSGVFVGTVLLGGIRIGIVFLFLLLVLGGFGGICKYYEFLIYIDVLLIW